MRANVFIGTLVIAGMAGLALWSWTSTNGIRHARGALAALKNERAALDAKLGDAERRLAEADGERSRRKAALDTLQKTIPAPAVAKTAPAAPRQSLNITELIRNEPDAEVLFLAANRAKLAARYGPLFRMLGLSSSQAASFQDHHIKRDEARMDLEDVLRTQGQAASGVVNSLRSAAEKAYATAQRGLLGESGFQALQDYERTSWIRGMVSAIAGAAVLEQAPFTPDQADRLVQTIANTSASYRQGGEIVTAEIDWDAVDLRARAILSPAQYIVFSTMDTGPTRGALLQTRMYALVSRVNAAERDAASLPASKPPGD